jgi:hypothetical protein
MAPDLSTGQSLGLRWQYTIYFVLALLALIFTAGLLSSSSEYFIRFFGETNPIFIVGLVAILGALALWSLQSNYDFLVVKRGHTLRGIALAATLSALLAVAIIIADLILRYPQDLNVPVPQALLFYPAVGFVAEIAFHLLPLAMLLLAMKPLVRHLGKQRVVWIGILLVALLEPSYQLLFDGKAATVRSAYTWVHVFVIGLLQLWLFRRFGFAVMYGFRFFYYIYWHILWGVARLNLM